MFFFFISRHDKRIGQSKKKKKKKELYVALSMQAYMIYPVDCDLDVSESCRGFHILACTMTWALSL